MTPHLTTQIGSSSGKLAQRLNPWFSRTPTLTLGLLVALPASASSLIPHRAVYELSLATSARDSGIAQASGLYVFEVTGAACAGWTMASDMVLSLEGPTGAAIRTQTTYRAFEGADGQVFTFQTNSETNQDEPISVTGAAERGIGGSLEIRRFGDQQSTSAAVAETLFPNQLTEAVLQAAGAGEQLIFSTVFDGSHDAGMAQPVSAIIGRERAPTVIRPLTNGVDAASDETRDIWRDFPAPERAWPVTLSYFDPEDVDAGPSFVVNYSLDTNGVSDDLELDYGSFTLHGALIDFAPYRPDACE